MDETCTERFFLKNDLNEAYLQVNVDKVSRQLLTCNVSEVSLIQIVCLSNGPI